MPHGIARLGRHVANLTRSIAHSLGRIGVYMQACAVQPVDDGLPDVHDVLLGLCAG